MDEIPFKRDKFAYEYFCFIFQEVDEGKAPDVDLVKMLDPEVKDTVDFSGILTSLKEEASIFTMSQAEVVSSSTPDQSRKRKLTVSEVVEGPGDYVTVNVMDLEQLPDSSTSDHDYVSKKPRLESTSSEIESPSPVVIASSSSTETSTTPKTKYRERRDKNNAASRRSRQIRKMKYVEMEGEADILEANNENLRKKIVELEKLAKFMKAELIKKMTEK